MSRVPLQGQPARAGHGGLAAAWAGLPPGPRVAAVALAGWMALALSLAGADLLVGIAGNSGAAAGGPAPGANAPPPALEAIVQRPLFSATRRPDTPPPTMAQAAPPPPPPPRDRQISLKGVYMDGAQAKAFVVSAEQPEGAWVSAGGRVGPWRVAAISAERVRFEAEGESFSATMSPEPGHP